MATSKDFADFISDQLQAAGAITTKKMFGEYGIYLEGVFFGLLCDNNLFIKPTQAGREFIGIVTEASPYPGARLYFLIGEKIEDSEWLSQLARVTKNDLDVPEKKKKKKRGTRS